MEIRRQKKQKEIQDTLLSEAILIEHSKQLAGRTNHPICCDISHDTEQERDEQAQRRQQKKHMQQRLFEENASLLEKRARDKAEREERERYVIRRLAVSDHQKCLFAVS